MRLSNGELISLLKRAFEGAGWGPGHYEEAANCVWWLEAHGFNWINRLSQIWRRLDQLQPPAPELSNSLAANGVINAHDASFLFNGMSSIDILYANTFAHQLATLEIRQCVDRASVLPMIAQLSERNTNAMARWSSPGELHIASVDASNPFPVYTRHHCEKGRESEYRTLYIACSQKPEALDHFHRSASKLSESHVPIEVLSSQRAEQHAKSSLADGIEIKDTVIDLLNHSAAKILVPSSKLSRQGAG